MKIQKAPEAREFRIRWWDGYFTPTRRSIETCQIWDTVYNSDNWKPEIITTFVTWHSKVTLDSICKSCDIYVFKFEMKLWILAVLQWDLSLYILVSDNLLSGGRSSLGRLHRHLYSPVPNHFPTTTTFLANASIPSIRSTLPSYYSTLYPLPWDWSCTSVLCSFYVLKFQIGKRLWLLFFSQLCNFMKDPGVLWVSSIQTQKAPDFQLTI